MIDPGDRPMHEPSRRILCPSLIDNAECVRKGAGEPPPGDQAERQVEDREAEP